MQDFDSVSASSTDPAQLVEQLSEKSKDGWHVIAIVPTGGNITAFLSKATGEDGGGDGATRKPAATSDDSGAIPTVSSVGAGAASSTTGPATSAREPAGWGSAPSSTAPSTPGAPPTPSTPSTPSGPSTPSTPSFQAASVAPGVVAPAATPATPSVPAGWYSDPAGRYELRYWDGKAWTEHVSRGGQQATDPPTR